MGVLRLDPMKPFAIAALLTAALTTSAQDAPTIKGHKIGESFNDYLIVENGSAENAARLMTDCAALLNNAKQRRKQEYRFETCSHYGEAIRGLTTTLPGNRGGKFQFASTKLVQITFAVDQEFAAVESDLIEKFGRPDAEEEVRYQNGFGATFFHPSASWTKRRDVLVTVAEDATATPGILFGKEASPPVNLIRVLIIDRSYAESQAAEKERERPNSLN